MGTGEKLLSVTLSIIAYQLFLSHLLLYCPSHAVTSHLKCARVWRRCGGHRGSLTLFAVTIHPWMDLTVHLSHVQSLALETGNMRKHIKDKEGSKVLSGLPVELDAWLRQILKWTISEFVQCRMNLVCQNFITIIIHRIHWLPIFFSVSGRRKEEDKKKKTWLLKTGIRCTCQFSIMHSGLACKGRCWLLVRSVLSALPSPPLCTGTQFEQVDLHKRPFCS